MKWEKVALCIIIIALFTAFAGCQSKEAAIPPITPVSEVSKLTQSKFGQVFQLPVVTSEPDPDGAAFQGIGFAADNAYIMVQFTDSPSRSQEWQQDFIYVMDEKTHVIYKDVPVMPKIGPLIGRPSKEGQPGYFMLENYDKKIQSGSVVSVVLGNYKREHVVVP